MDMDTFWLYALVTIWFFAIVGFAWALGEFLAWTWNNSEDDDENSDTK